mgnify:FL=1
MITPIQTMTIDQICNRQDDLLVSVDDIREVAKRERNKAIDDFAETCKQDVMCQTFGLHPRNIDEIAEQLKGGGADGN